MVSFPRFDRLLSLNVMAFLSLSAVAWAGAARTVQFPEDSGYVNITKAPYLAVGDGKMDCTEIFQKALDADRRIFVPAGTYLVSDIVHWGLNEPEAKRKIIQGENRDKVIIKLKDKAAGYDQIDRPKEVLRMSSRGDLAGPANAFRNALFDLTIDVGHGNPGAIGVLFYAHNQGSMEHIRIVSPSVDSGLVGVDMYRGLTGPALLKDITVEGFEYGMRVGGTVRQLTFSEIYLKNQRRYGIYNDNNVLAIEDLVSENKVPALHNRANWGFFTLINATLTGGAAEANALENINGRFFVRNLKTAGYGQAILNRGTKVAGPNVEEYVSDEPIRLLPAGDKSLNLPIEKTPESLEESPDKWVSVLKFGPPRESSFDVRGKPRAVLDYSEVIQRAIDSGARTIYFPPLSKVKGEQQEYWIQKTVLLRGKVERIIFMDASLQMRTGEAPAFKIVDGEAPQVILERFAHGYGGDENNFEVETNRKVIFKNCIPGNIKATNATLFFEDVCLGHSSFKNCTVWARQLNPEPKEGTMVDNDGGTVWIMGIKTEQNPVIFHSRNGAKTEVLGGMVYANAGYKRGPMIVTENSQATFSLASCCHNGFPFNITAQEERGQETAKLLQSKSWARDGWGVALPLYVAVPKEGGKVTYPNLVTGNIITDLAVDGPMPPPIPLGPDGKELPPNPPPRPVTFDPLELAKMSNDNDGGVPPASRVDPAGAEQKPAPVEKIPANLSKEERAALAAKAKEEKKANSDAAKAASKAYEEAQSKAYEPYRYTASQRFSLHRNLVEGEIYIANRQYIIRALPKILEGGDFIRVNTDLNKTADPAKPLLSFKITEDAAIFITQQQEGFEVTGEKIEYDYSLNWPPTRMDPTPWASAFLKQDPIFKKAFKAGETVSLLPGTSIVVAQPLNK
jgi:Pectate lyase superfamily protein